MSDVFDTIVPPHIQRLRPYQPGRPIEEVERELGLSGVIKLASNENPLGPSPLALAAARDAAARCHLYPDGGAFRLRVALGAHLGVEPSRLVFGAGADDLIYMLVKAFCRPGDQVLTHACAFISYKIAATGANAEFVETPITSDLRCDVDALIAAMGERTRVVFLANPNNPTGAHLGRAELERILEAAPPRAVVVIDEAYHEYARAADPAYPSSQDYAAERPLLCTLRTFSKIYGLAGMRIGYAICSERLASTLERVRLPFNPGSVAQEAALAALGDHEHVERSQRGAIEAIAALRAGAEALGLRAVPSLANFVCVDVGRDAGPVSDALLRRGVIVRPLAAWGLPSCVRISVGTAGEIERALAALGAVLG